MSGWWEAYTERPEEWEIDPFHQLARGLVFFGGGAMAGSSKYVDSSLYGNDGDLANFASSQWINHLGRAAFSTNGSNQCAYMGTGNAHLALTGEMSLAFWHKPTNTTSYNALFWNIDGSGSNGYWGLEMGIGQDFRYRFWSGGYHGVSDTDITDTSTWVHVAVVKTGSSGNWTASYYVDGKSHGTGASSTDTNGSVATAGAAVGRLGALGVLYATASFADPAIWNRALSLPEIQLQASGDPMLGGLILPPARKWWPVTSGGGAPSASTWIWSRQHTSQVIGGGAI